MNLRSKLYPDTLLFPRTEHILQALHIFKYLEIDNKNNIAFDTCYNSVTSDQDIQGKVEALEDYYFDAGEGITPNAPITRGKTVQVNCFSNYDHSGYRATWKSEMEIILYCN